MSSLCALRVHEFAIFPEEPNPRRPVLGPRILLPCLAGDVLLIMCMLEKRHPRICFQFPCFLYYARKAYVHVRVRPSRKSQRNIRIGDSEISKVYIFGIRKQDNTDPLACASGRTATGQIRSSVAGHSRLECRRRR